MKKKHIQTLRASTLTFQLDSWVPPYASYQASFADGVWTITDELGDAVAEGKVSRKGMKIFQAVLEQQNAVADGALVH